MTSSAAYQQDIHISGDVRIDSSAVIAPGVIIQAAQDSYVAIAAGVCIGMGSIIQAIQGSIEIQQGVTLGAGVLIIGSAKIGENTCIGYGTTIFQASVSARQVLAPNSLIGDNSRKPNSQPPPFIPPQSTKPKSPPTTNDFDPWNPTSPPEVKVPAIKSPPQQPQTNNFKKEWNPTSPPQVKVPAIEPPSQQPQTNNFKKEPNFAPEIILDIVPKIPEILEKEADNTPKPPVVGQAYINQLLMTLFPHNNQIKPIDTSQ